uniref:Uncharacterized protein n=1 Tax=Myoviridae sp. cte0p10 TaxID=2826674 RepID=A0A8S5NFV8_9CAUD|nr:MAG TPA: hypothetical protein [Myoviridae sp. cte0p10]
MTNCYKIKTVGSDTGCFVLSARGLKSIIELGISLVSTRPKRV